MKMSLRDARLQVMRGNLDPKAVKKEEVLKPEIVPEPIAPAVAAGPTSITIDTEPMAKAVIQSSQMMARAMETLKTEPLPPTKKWNFKVTERDRAGNIVSFTAEAQ